MISVCMATYNGKKYIKEQLESILSQLGAEDEVIVSDDCSTDGTIDIVNGFNDDRIKVVSNEFPKGSTGNFYNALKHAKGDHIFLADQDDVWVEDKVKVTLEMLKKYDFLVSDCYETNEKLDIVYNSRFERFNVKDGVLYTLFHCRYLGCCMAFNRCVLDGIFPPPKHFDRIPHDLWIALIGEKYFSHALINKQLIYYRRHGANVSNGGDETKGNRRSLFTKISCRFVYFGDLSRQSRFIGKRG